MHESGVTFQRRESAADSSLAEAHQGVAQLLSRALTTLSRHHKQLCIVSTQSKLLHGRTHALYALDL